MGAEELRARPRRPGFPSKGAWPPGCSAEVMQVREAAFPVEKISGLPVVITPEEIDITNADGLRAALLRAAAQGRKTYVVDITRTRFCDSAGLHALLGARRRARAEGGEVRFVVTGPAVRRILAIMAIDRVIPVFGRLDEALTPPARSDLSG
jgi:anti-sigma B factor antagonist